MLERDNIPLIARAFQGLGWDKPASQYEHYLMEQILEIRDVYVAFIEERFMGYLTICWTSSSGTLH